MQQTSKMGKFVGFSLKYNFWIGVFALLMLLIAKLLPEPYQLIPTAILSLAILPFAVGAPFYIIFSFFSSMFVLAKSKLQHIPRFYKWYTLVCSGITIGVVLYWIIFSNEKDFGNYLAKIIIAVKTLTN